jgi:hypothetical protein
MRAIVSGQARVALLLEGERLSSLHAGGGVELVPRSPREIPYLLGDARDLQILERVEVSRVSEALERAVEEADAFHLTLILLDGTLQPDTREEAALELEDLLNRRGVLEFLEKIFFAHPLPHEADLQGALAYRVKSASELGNFLRTLSSCQRSIAEISHAWNSIPVTIFETEAERAAARSVVIQAGIFRELALSGSAIKENGAPWGDLFHRPVHGLHNKQAILTSWFLILHGEDASEADRDDSKELIAGFQTGLDIDVTFRRLYEKYHGVVWYFFRSMRLSPQESEDLTQDTFLRAFHATQTLGNETSLKKWLLSIAVDVWRDELRRRSGEGEARMLLKLEPKV